MMDALGVFSTFDYAVLLINLLLFVFARQAISITKGKANTTVADLSIVTLRAVNILLFLLYMSALLFSDSAKQLSQTGLVLVLSVLVAHTVSGTVLKYFGRTREIDGEQHRSETYQSEIFGLIVIVLAGAAALILIINIWGMTSWLKTTSLLGGLLIILYSTKDVWAPENINGLILLYNGDVEPGSLVRVDDLGILAVVLQTSLTQTRLRDLVSRHIVVVPNSRLRNAKIEILSKGTAAGVYQFVEFKIGYHVSAEAIDALFTTIWEQASDVEKSINAERPCVAKISETGDHAVVWKLCYWVKNSYGIVDAMHAINRAAFEQSSKFGIDLNTPLTHTVEQQESKHPVPFAAAES
ncbi:MAG: hypothetical protein AAF384_14525 [Pseudomonadota bacterium]